MARKTVRERLLDAADSVMFIEGAVGTSVDAILREAGASPASLYTQFGSKEGLVAAALERRLEVWTRVWDAAIASCPTPEERLLAVFDAMRTYHDEHLAERWCAFSGTAAVLRSPGPAIAEVLAAETELLTTRLHELSVPVAGEGAAELSDQLLIAYCGMLAAMLRLEPHQAMDRGRAVARTLVAAHARPQEGRSTARVPEGEDR